MLLSGDLLRRPNCLKEALPGCITGKIKNKKKTTTQRRMGRERGRRQCDQREKNHIRTRRKRKSRKEKKAQDHQKKNCQGGKRKTKTVEKQGSRNRLNSGIEKRAGISAETPKKEGVQATTRGGNDGGMDRWGGIEAVSFTKGG